MLEVIKLNKYYGENHAVKDLSFKIDVGEIFCLLGPNGAGKTTTINLFLNFIQPTSGEILINGLNVVEKPLKSKEFIAYIPEQVMLYGNMTGFENLKYFSSLAGQDYTDTQYRSFLTEVGLQPKAIEEKISKYSKGMRQKVGIAIAVAKRAGALLMDEPTSGLDPKASYEFSELIKSLSTKGTAILMATHDLFRAKDVGKRIGIMKQGSLVSIMTAEDVLNTDLEKIYLDHMKN